MRTARFTLDPREISAILGRTALGSSRRVLITAIALIVVMGVVTGVLARAYHDAERRGAEEQFRLGEQAMTGGRSSDALEHYRAALALERDNAGYRRALALALLGLRRTAEAETHLAQLLEHDPVDGEANLLLARLAASRGDFTETEAFYQRAIYGRWPVEAEAAARRLAARFELIEWLTQMDARPAARAELLRLQAELPDVPFLQRELADRLLDLGQPSQAAGILRRELDRRPADASVAADLAQAEMAAGQFPEAHYAARRAVALDPRDRRSRDRLERISEALSLDPTQRGLSAAERFRRSQRLLAKVTTVMRGNDPAACLAATPDNQGLLSNAQRLLDDEKATGPAPIVPASIAPPQSSSAEQKPPTATADATSQPTVPSSMQGRTDARLAAAESLWNARVPQCGASDEALAWIFDRLSR